MTPATRAAIELCLIPEMMLRVWGALDFTFSAQAQRARVGFRAAKDAAMKLAAPSEHEEVRRVTDRIVAEAQRSIRATDRIGLTAFHLARLLTENDHLFIGDSDPLRVGLDVMLPALHRVADDERLNEAAIKSAVRIIRDAQRRGLFLDFPLEIA